MRTHWLRWFAGPLLLMFVPSSQADQDSAQIRTLMHLMVLEYAKMSPYLADENSFESEQGRRAVGDSLTALQTRIKTSGVGDNSQHGPGFKVNFNLLQDFVGRTKQAFDSGELEHARFRAKSIGTLCASCHMQSPRISNFSAFEFVVQREKTVSFANANFLFVIRRYDQALTMLDELIREYPKSKINSDQLPEALRQKVSILVRVFRSPDKTIASLKEDLKNEDLPSGLRASLRSWIGAAQAWKSEPRRIERMSPAELVKYAEGQIPKNTGRNVSLAHPDVLKLLRVSGLLYENLFEKKSDDQTQAMLFLLARCERSLAPLYWYSLNEIYLKQCVTQYRKQTYSKKCFDAYEEGMRERYSGKTLPENVRHNIEALKDYL